MALSIRQVNNKKVRPVAKYYDKRVDPECYLGQKLRVVAYCRVSTELEEQQSSFKTQVDFYTRYINENPNWELVKVYADDGASGTQIYFREDFQKMIEDAEAGMFDLVLTKSFTRFARNTVDTINVVRRFTALGIDIFFEDKNLHTINQDSEFMITIHSAFAQEENREKSQSVTWGYSKKFERGEVLVSNLLGYQSKHCEISIIKEEAITIHLINQLLLEGHTFYTIKKELEARGIRTKRGKDKWEVSVIKNILLNEKYAGNAVLQKTVTLDFMTKTRAKNTGQKKKYYVENTHPAIISSDIHDLVINEIKHRELMSSEQKQKDGRDAVRSSLDKNCNYSSKYYLSNIMTCEDCGSPFRRYTWTARGTTKYVWMCKVRKTKGGRKTCPLSPSIEEKDLHFAIVHAINVAAKNIEINDESSIVEDNVQFNLKKIDECTKELELLNQKLKDAVANNESEESIIDIKYEISLLNLELAKFKYLNQQIKSTEDQLNSSTVSMNKYSDELLKLYVRSIKVTNKGDLKITFKSGLEMQAACRCTLASA